MERSHPAIVLLLPLLSLPGCAPDDPAPTTLPPAPGIAAERSLPKTQASVRLGADASLPFSLAESAGGLKVSVRLLGAQPVAPRRERGEARYPDALGPGVEVALRAGSRGVEDRIYFLQKPAEELLRYEVELEGVAALRQAPGTEVLELLDARGAPRLRVRAPWGEDARGKRFDATLGIRGCAVDRDPRGPWGRSLAPPGAERCAVEVRWSAPSYPAMLDPVWETTDSLSVPRSIFTATKLQDGRVLVAGGDSKSNLYQATAELYDPTTGTWATTGSMPSQRAYHQATRLLDGSVLLAGGQSLNSAAPTIRYFPAEGTFTEVASPIYLSAHGQALLPGGDVLVAGIPAAYRIQVSSGFSLKQLPPLSANRYGVFTVELPDGRVLVGGGPLGVLTADLFDPTTDTWSPTLVPGGAHSYGTGSLLPDGRALVAGGLTPSNQSTGVVALFDAKTNLWSLGPSLQLPRYNHTTTALPDGRLLIAGGQEIPSNPWKVLSATEQLDLVGKTSTAAGKITERHGHQAVLLDDGSVLLIGGISSNEVLATVLRCPGGVCEDSCSTSDECPPGQLCRDEVCQPPAKNGVPCASDEQCASGFCVEQVCCNAACEGTCVSCLVSRKLSGSDGTCGPISPSTDPKNACDLDGTPCGADGLCDGQGACRTAAPAGKLCNALTCKDAAVQALACDGKGSCSQTVPPKVPCAPYGCAGNACAISCSEDSGCDPGFVCVGSVCKGKLGAACIAGEDCSSGFCSGGNCCDAPCKGPCERCFGVPGVPAGQCAPVPAGEPGKCGLGECAPRCDGVSTQSCAVVIPDGKSCGVPFCAGDKRRLPACEAGQCVPKDAPCSPYICIMDPISSEPTCKTGCASDLDCTTSATCQGTACVPKENAGGAGGNGGAGAGGGTDAGGAGGAAGVGAAGEVGQGGAGSGGAGSGGAGSGGAGSGGAGSGGAGSGGAGAGGTGSGDAGRGGAGAGDQSGSQETNATLTPGGGCDCQAARPGEAGGGWGLLAALAGYQRSRRRGRQR